MMAAADPKLASARSSLKPDIEVTRRAIERVAFSLSSDPEEQVEIIAKAAFGTLILMMGKDMASEVFRAVADDRLPDLDCIRAIRHREDAL